MYIQMQRKHQKEMQSVQQQCRVYYMREWLLSKMQSQCTSELLTNAVYIRMTDIHSERLTIHQNLSQTSKVEVLNFGTRIISHSMLFSRLYVHWGHFGLEDSTLIVVALILPSSPSLSLASQTLSGVWL